MTNQDFQLKKAALAIKAMFGLAAIIASFAFLIQSSSTATADAPTATNEAGKYQMQFQAEMDERNDEMNFYILVWDTSTGRSKLYYGSVGAGRITAATSPFNLPSSPL